MKKKYRIVKNGLDEYFVERLDFIDIPPSYKIINNLSAPSPKDCCPQNRRIEQWNRCAYEVNYEEGLELAASLKYHANYAYLSIDRAKEGLEIIKNRELREELSQKIEVVHEE